jgi:hypothetical protein
MKKYILMLLSLMLFASCEPIQIEVSDNAEKIENTENDTETEDDDLNGGLEDPIENPEMDW